MFQLTAPTECADDEFKCFNSQNSTMCIHMSWRCDGSADCDDESDETGCQVNRCGASHFTCVSGDECIHELWICDGDFDCSDGSDEHNCKSRTLTPIARETLTVTLYANNECIHEVWLNDRLLFVITAAMNTTVSHSCLNYQSLKPIGAIQVEE